MRDSLGKVQCPVCGALADVRLAKKGEGYAYVFCDTSCNIQIFTRNKYQHEKLLARLGSRPIDSGQNKAEVVQPVKTKIGTLLDE